MKRVISIILCLTMLFVMAAVPALAADGEDNWKKLLDENFGSYDEGYSFDTERAYENVKSYIWSGSASTVTNAVGTYNGEKALKIERTGSGDKRLLFGLKEHRSGQFKISLKVLATAISSGVVRVEVLGETADGTFGTNSDGGFDFTLITGTQIDANKLWTSYDGVAKPSGKANSVSLPADTWLSISYILDTESGNVDAYYSFGDSKPEKKITGTKSFPAVAGLGVRSTGSSAVDVYVDDIVIEYYEEPAAAESEFDFDDFKGENTSAAEVTKALALPLTFTDSDKVAWNIEWASNSAAIDAQTGAVKADSVDTEVTLTAKFTNADGTKTFTKKFTVTVPAILKEFDFSKISSESVNGVTNNLNLIKTYTDNEGREWGITWNCDRPDIIAADGTVTAGGVDERVKLTASLTDYADGTESERIVTKIFNVKVLATGTYHVKEGFDAEGDYSDVNAIKTYTGAYNLTWGVATDYNYYEEYDDTSKFDDMNANISVDPENPADKVLKLHRSVSASQPSVQRVWTAMNKDASALNDKVYVGMRVLRENIFTSTDIYAYDTDGDRLMYIKLNANNQMRSYYWDGTTFDDHGNNNAFPANEWFDITLEFDMKNGTYSVYVDGVAKRTGLAMADKGSFGGLMFDIPRGGYAGVTTTYIDDITVRTTGGFPYSIVGYNFTDAEGYPAKSMVEGGKLKSIDMRKMSAVDAGTEPSVYVGFFKGEVLCDMISAPIDEAGALGGFEATFNKALPENVLDYNIKTFVFSKDLVPLMVTSSYEPFEVIPTIYAAGDSIAAQRSAKEYPMSGYIQELGAFVDEDAVNIENHAIGGRSSKSFYDEGSLDKILDKIYSGDYLFIQFGHNDESGKGEYRETDPEAGADVEGSYKWYLMKYIDGAKDRGATPVLITPPSRNYSNDSGLYDERVAPYAQAMRELAADTGVAILDLNLGWKEFVDNATEKGIDSTNFYATFYPNDARFVNEAAWSTSGNNPDNTDKYDTIYSCYVVNPDDATDMDNHIHSDGSHLNVYGAKVAAKIIADAIKVAGLDLADCLVENIVAECPWDNYATFGEIKARN